MKRHIRDSFNNRTADIFGDPCPAKIIIILHILTDITGSEHAGASRQSNVTGHG